MGKSDNKLSIGRAVVLTGVFATLLVGYNNCTNGFKVDGSTSSQFGSSGSAGSGDDAPAGPVVGIAEPMDIVDASGNIVPSAYRDMASQLSSDTGIAYRYGPNYSVYNPNGGTTAPTYYQRPNIIVPGYNNIQMIGNVGGPYTQDSGDWYVTASNAAFIPDNPAQNFGMTQFQSAAQTKNVFFAAPQTFPPYAEFGLNDPSGLDFRKAGVDYSKPIAMARCNGHPGWCLVGISVFQNGLVATARGGNTSLNKAMTQLAPGKIPTGIAQTNSSEFALVTVWDTVNLKGQVAVIAIGAMCNGCKPEVPDTNDDGWGEWAPLHPGLTNRGNINFLKVLGYIDLPDMKAPTEIAATTGWNPWEGRVKTADGKNYSSNYKMPLADETARQTYINGVNSESYSRAGIAIVISKSEKKATFIDLKPLFNYFNSMYFGPRANFDSIANNTGAGANQWPYTFAQVPSMMPTIIKTISFDSKPTAVKTSQYRRGDDSPHRAWIATQEGLLHIFDLGTALDTHSAFSASSIVKVGQVTVGRNPTSLSTYRAYSSDASNEINKNIIVLSRGDRRIEWVKFTGNNGTVTKTLRDSRLNDPIAIDDLESHGTSSPLISIADYGAKAILQYKYGPTIFYTNPGGSCPAPGGCPLIDANGGSAEFEFGGRYNLPGKPFVLTNANCP